jgi:hypothetical protein
MKMSRISGVVSILFLMSLLSGCFAVGDPGTGEPAAKVVETEDLGPVDQGDNLKGRDGGYSGIWNDQLVWVFGDSVTQRANSDGQNWFSNSWSASNDFNASDGLDQLQLGTDTTNEVTELLPYTAAEQAFNDSHSGVDCLSPCGARYALWPGLVIADPKRDRSIVFYQKVYAEPGEFNFSNVGYSLALDNLLDPSAWSYAYSGDQWTANPNDADDLFLGAEIMALGFNKFLDRYIVVYSEPLGGPIVMRTASTLTGEWSKPVVLVYPEASENTNGWVYDGLMHPDLAEQDGRVIYVTYTRDVAAEREMRLVRVTLARN